MSTQQQPTVRQYQGVDDIGSSADAYSGWVMFAGVMLALLGSMNVIYGIAAIGDSSFFVGEAEFVFSGLKTFGWVLLLIGAAQLLTAAGVWARWTGVRWVGVTFAALNAIVQLLALPAYPVWAVCLFTLDVLVIYALVVHAGRRA